MVIKDYKLIHNDITYHKKVYDTREMNLLKERIADILDTNRYKGSMIEDEVSVYVIPGTGFSRDDFKNSYPNAKICMNPKDADIIIYSKKKIDMCFSVTKSFVVSTVLPDRITFTYSNSKYAYPFNYMTDSEVRMYPVTSEAVEKRIGNLEKVFVDGTKKKFMNIIDLKINKGREMTQDDFNFIKTSVTSEDPDMVQLGFVLFREFDYEKYKSYIAYFLAISNWAARGNVTDQIKFRTVYNKVIADFKKIRMGGMNGKSYYYDEAYFIMELVYNDATKSKFFRKMLSNKIKSNFGIDRDPRFSEKIYDLKEIDDPGLFSEIERNANESMEI